MSPGDIFVSKIRSVGDLAGVFEYDGETGYFYKYDQDRMGGTRVLAAIHIVSGKVDFAESDVEVRWGQGDEWVGLFIRGELWAAFGTSEKVGGNYRPGGHPRVPDSVIAAFPLR